MAASVVAQDATLARIRDLLRAECGIGPGTLLVAAVSGGADSLCLLHALLELGHRPLVAHFDHQLRVDSSVDALWVERLAGSLGLPFATASLDVRLHATTKRISIETAGRDLRYAFLFEQAHAHAAAAVAVGHTADDQAETILMHILRGAGLSGLRGMGARVVRRDLDHTIPIVRPLLDVRRAETHEFCRRRSLSPLEDSSNSSREYLRNRIRLDLIPNLETYNPRLHRALVRLGRSAADDLAIIDDLVTAAWERVVSTSANEFVALDSARLQAEPRALQARLIGRAASTLKPASELDFNALSRAQQFISDPSARRLDLGDGLILQRESHCIFLALGEQALPTDLWPQLPRNSVAIGPAASVTIQLLGRWRFTCELNEDVAALSIDPSGQDPYHGCLDADSLPRDLELRAPQNGDRIQPFGLAGHSRKLSDVFINLGVPQRLRACWPVLASGRDVVWVPGYRIAEPYCIGPRTRRAATVAVLIQA